MLWNEQKQSQLTGKDTHVTRNGAQVDLRYLALEEGLYAQRSMSVVLLSRQ